LRQLELAKKNLKLMFLGQQGGGYFDRILDYDIIVHIYPERKTFDGMRRCPYA
jgi:hypothetical protein